MIEGIECSIPDNQLINVIIENNKHIADEMKSANSKFEFVFPNQSSQRIFKKRATCRCSSNIRSTILKKAFVTIDYDSCKDHIYVPQCMKCAALGHTTKSYTNKPTCIYCSGSHEGKDCPTGIDQNRNCCANCLNSNNYRLREDGISHQANSYGCPLYLRELSKIALKTDYGNDYPATL